MYSLQELSPVWSLLLLFLYSELAQTPEEDEPQRSSSIVAEGTASTPKRRIQQNPTHMPSIDQVCLCGLLLDDGILL
jgi:hypothetical protein